MKENVRRKGRVITTLFKSVGDRVLPSRREKVKGRGTAGLDNKALTEQKSPRFVEVTELEGHSLSKKGLQTPGTTYTPEENELYLSDV